MQLTSSSMGLAAGVVVILAYFTLVAHLTNTLRQNHRLPVVIGALAGLLGVLPAILYALNFALGATA
ncbi:hypothetical protein [Streptomyces sp. NPDC001985]|uniref:hypothetical protein n=1 Tax=Streptomyces sp. NPDC001985 TaxID=3154406 RepID=UPI00332B8B3A